MLHAVDNHRLQNTTLCSLVEAVYPWWQTPFAVGFMSCSLRIVGRISQSNFPDSLGRVAE